MDINNEIKEPIFTINSTERIDSHHIGSKYLRTNPRDVAASRFAKYCFIYDPLVDLNTGNCQTTFIKPSAVEYEDEHTNIELQIVMLKNFLKIPSLSRLREQYNERSHMQGVGPKVIYYICKAPLRIINPQSVTEKYLHDYCSGKIQPKRIRNRIQIQEKDDDSNISDSPTRSSRNLMQKEMAKKFETSEILCYKHYICCEHEGEKGWMIFYMSPKFSLYDLKKTTIGVGKNIVEADLDFQSQRASLLLEEINSNQRLLDSDVPFNIEQMKKECQKYDKGIRLDSFEHKYITSSPLGIKFELSCKSNQYKFTVIVYRSRIKWTVETYIKAACTIPIEAEGEALGEAFEALTKKYDRLSSDSEFIRKEVSYINQEIQEQQVNDYYDNDFY